MTTKLSVLLILLSFNTELPKLVAQNTQNSTLVNSLSSIIYTDNTGKDTVGVQVGGIWWAPVNVKISGNNDADSSFFSYQEADPCPYGWRLPTLEEIKKLERVVKSGKGEFDYDSKNFKIKGDDGKSQLLIPANGVMSTSGSIRNKGLSGSIWSSSTAGNDFNYQIYFQGNSLSVASSPKYLKLNIRCVCEMQ
ncbi:FISUMP domain-containing protein [Dysgonomonas capnocytophagoides]|uniref:FISUMP domain-containing protein n=1 Tax=Dysgonomonas capnocytophagoides TaxID=45254 RepID=UPI00334087D2